MSKPLISLLLDYPLDDGLVDTIAEIPIDVCKTRTYKFGAEVTSFPVEGGSTIEDHVRLQPDEISLEGFVSDAPVTTVALEPLLLRGDTDAEHKQGANNQTQSAYDVLVAARNKRQPITTVTEYQVFNDMIITELSIPRTADGGMGLHFSMTLKHISVVYTATASLPSSIVARLKRKKRGKSSLSAPKAKLAKKIEQSDGKFTKTDADKELAAATKGKAKKAA